MSNQQRVLPTSEPGPHGKLLALINALSASAHGDPAAQDLSDASAAAKSGNYTLAFNSLGKYYNKIGVTPL